MYSKIIISTILFFNFIYSFGQKSDYLIQLSKEKFEINNTGFYIDKVLDNRVDTSSLGKIYSTVKQEYYVFKSEDLIENEIYNFISLSIPKIDTLIPIVIKINELNISEKFGFSSDKGIVILKLTFSRFNQSDSLIDIFETESNICESDNDILKTHEKRLRKAIIECLNNLINSGKINYSLQNINFKPEFIFENKKEAKIDLKIYPDEQYKTFTYKNREYNNLLQLEPILLDKYNIDIDYNIRSYRSMQNTAYIFSSIGGSIVGYELGYSLASGNRFNNKVLIPSAISILIAIVFSTEAKSDARKIIEKYNSNIEQAMSYYNEKNISFDFLTFKQKF